MVLSPGNKLKVFQLVFSDPGRSFYSSGEKLSGSVLLEAAQPCRVTGLRVTAAGCARVEHRGGKNRKNRSQEVEYLKYEEELRLEEQLSKGSDGCFLLQPAKTYSFQFGFELPAAGRLVSSYKGKFGYVRYYVRAVLDKPSQHALQCEREFEVEEPLDVNRPDLLAPAAASRQKKVTCMFIPDGQVSVSARIDRKGFCEGEDINISAKFENTCSRIVVPKAAIIAKHSYVADGHTKVFRQKLSAVRGNHIISGMCDMWQGKTIRVPKLKPSLLGCDIIKVDYALMIYLHIPGSEKLVLELPLVIGTIPFSGVGSRTSSMSSQAGSLSSQAGSLSSWSSLPSAPPSYSNIHRDLRVDGPRTPLLQDYDGVEDDEDEGGLFMRAPEVYYPPPPAYSEVDQGAVNPPQVVQVF
ncbi:thioredoxin-interacting protein-like [Micropterus salmoides]|uniref:thioredoxin-interacting protein-like n=1 Tax=Micropterus salmoides TaxID=27706 RepID=UPI0018EB8BE4|nr:thioredoxin-interacting protein-like [Micropterus salmoides]XP_045899853.1 thioredoxin-interacting protein-like [Micropterus dolomieu]